MSETTFSVDTALAFDAKKQAAILGWVLRDDLFCRQAVDAIKAGWFSNPYVMKLFDAVLKIFRDHHRRPSPLELKGYGPFTQEDSRTQQRLFEALENAMRMSEVYGLDLLRTEITDWMHAVMFLQGVQQAALQYNSKKIGEAWNLLDEMILQKKTATFEDGINQGFVLSTERIVTEAASRIEESQRLLSYGVTFLDRALGGISPQDLVVLGAKTGAGKTQLATSIALHNARQGKSVYYFALEAEQDEIERRIKYGLLADAHYGDPNRSQSIDVNYANWRLGRLEDALKKYEAQTGLALGAVLANLRTLYRTRGDFGQDALAKNLLSIVNTADLVIIDHLHYIDTNDENENFAYKRTIKLIRDIVLRYRVPVVLIAHLRKSTATRNPPLIADIEDFHGTSDVPKIATTCIMLAPANDQDAQAKHLRPTYMKIVKNRLNGGLPRYCALTHFNLRSNGYEPDFEVGALSGGDTAWDPVPPEKLPTWALRKR